MPKGPRGEKRPADVEQEELDTPEQAGKDPNAAALGKKGGAARARSLTPEQRAEIAKKAAAKRWAKQATRE